MTKELLLQELESVISLVEIYIMKGHLKMTSLQCPSDPDNDRRLGLVLIRLLDLRITLSLTYRSKNLKDL